MRRQYRVTIFEDDGFGGEVESTIYYITVPIRGNARAEEQAARAEAVRFRPRLPGKVAVQRVDPATGNTVGPFRRARP